MSTEVICPCETFEHPAAVSNLPGLSRVQYRIGDFRTFRRALLRGPEEGEEKEQALNLWRPNRQGDLLLQVFEWWAYIADVLTFYSERSLNENLLATAGLDESVRRIVRILGYRPKPGIGASAMVAALLSNSKSVTLPAGFAIDSKPTTGQSPQTFETTEPVTLTQPDAVTAEPSAGLLGDGGRLYLDGTDSSIQVGDILVLERVSSTTPARILIKVTAIQFGEDTAGNPYTAIVPETAPAVGEDAVASDYRLLRSRRSAGIWRYSPPELYDFAYMTVKTVQAMSATASKAVGTKATGTQETHMNLVASPLHLDGIERSVGAGDFMVLSALSSTGLAPVLLSVTGNTEEVWYLNGNGTTPPGDTEVPIGIPHSEISYTSSGMSATAWNAVRQQVKVLIDWQPMIALRDAPVDEYPGTPTELVAQAGSVFQTADGQTVLIEDADGNGVAAEVSASTSSSLFIRRFIPEPPFSLKTPLTVLSNAFSVSRGKSVNAEILGSGDATIAGQTFVLKNSPLTYFQSGDSVKSTLAVYVDGVQWTEEDNFYDQAPDARRFVTYEDDEDKTHVLFGDGVNGARLPTGTDNVVAYYRFGSGAEAPEAGSLTIIAKPQAGLRALRQPTDAGGGGDPDPSDRIRQYAPRSVLTFGRAISADDYEAIAAGAPDVQRVRAVSAWDPVRQRSTVILYVGDTASAVTSVREALALSADPNRPLNVQQARAAPVRISITLRTASDRLADDVIAAVEQALTNEETGLFSLKRVGIGQSFYYSQISAACLNVSGVESVAQIHVEPEGWTDVKSVIDNSLRRLWADPSEFFLVQELLVEEHAGA